MTALEIVKSWRVNGIAYVRVKETVLVEGEPEVFVYEANTPVQGKPQATILAELLTQLRSQKANRMAHFPDSVVLDLGPTLDV